MTRRPFRRTVRLSKREVDALTAFADSNHLTPSVALRCLIAIGLGWLTLERLQQFKPSREPERRNSSGTCA